MCSTCLGGSQNVGLGGRRPAAWEWGGSVCLSVRLSRCLPPAEGALRAVRERGRGLPPPGSVGWAAFRPGFGPPPSRLRLGKPGIFLPALRPRPGSGSPRGRSPGGFFWLPGHGRRSFACARCSWGAGAPCTCLVAWRKCKERPEVGKPGLKSSWAAPLPPERGTAGLFAASRCGVPFHYRLVFGTREAG